MLNRLKIILLGGGGSSSGGSAQTLHESQVFSQPFPLILNETATQQNTAPGVIINETTSR